jgi:hypothetical protein
MVQNWRLGRWLRGLLISSSDCAICSELVYSLSEYIWLINFTILAPVPLNMPCWAFFMKSQITDTHCISDWLPPRQFLRITDTGRLRFEEWLRSTSGSSVRAIRLEFITRLYFARRLFPTLIPMIIDRESAEIQGALIRLEKERDSVHPEQTFNRLSLDLRIQQLRSVQEWLMNVEGNLK